jgi:hypothetical protein
MDFAINYFGKDLNNITYCDVEEFFEIPRQENETIEFKSFAVAATFEKGLDTVIQTICAFLNSSGGLLIWGAPRGVKLSGSSEKVFQGALCPLNEIKEKDSLISKVSSNITPLPIGINVSILENDGRYLYIFEVQRSQYEPHQFQHKYHVRLDGQTVPAPHYLVEALMRQITFPNLAGVINFAPLKYTDNLILLPIKVGIFNFSELQNEENVSFRILCVGGYFIDGTGAQFVTRKVQYSMNGHELIYNNFAPVLHFGIAYTYENEIVVRQDLVKENNGKLNVLLSFGGKRSPAMTSQYVLTLQFLNGTRWVNVVIEEIYENELSVDRIKQLGTSKADTLRNFTGRSL